MRVLMLLVQVPEVNSGPLDAIPVNSLVRFRGMVQDMFDVEYYIGAYKASTCLNPKPIQVFHLVAGCEPCRASIFAGARSMAHKQVHGYRGCAFWTRG